MAILIRERIQQHMHQKRIINVHIQAFQLSCNVNSFHNVLSYASMSIVFHPSQCIHECANFSLVRDPILLSN
ncbi:hypothetical protein RchiOBHm_Chr2g0176021 [Rosa chinensis]|uniref:Uncharacterized protein n=1 Tax=Rosa chinensis TaxID=74649 RepID=A0A2P6S6K7_ROSCH|nr:hypothetical protein RchiOBHm_Chr2g0176021 [Rosa chinensis]